MTRPIVAAILFAILLALIGGCLIVDVIAEGEAEYYAEQTEQAARATAGYGAQQFHLQQTAQAQGANP